MQCSVYKCFVLLVWVFIYLVAFCFGLVCCLFDCFLKWVLGLSRTHSIDKTGLEPVAVSLPKAPSCWHYKHELPQLAMYFFSP